MRSVLFWLGLLVLGVVAAFAMALLLMMVRSRGLTAKAPPPELDVTVLVATDAIPAMSVLTLDHIQEKNLPREQAPEGYFSDSSQITGKVLSVPMIPGQAFTKRVFSHEGSGSLLASVLPPGKRAVNVSLQNSAGLDGLLYPGSLVDVLATFRLSSNSDLGNAVSTTLLENVEVLGVDNLTVTAPPTGPEDTIASQKSKSQEIMVTLMVEAKQAEALQLATEHGVVSLALRNPRDTDLLDAEPTLLNEGELASMAEFMAALVESKAQEAMAEEQAALEAEELESQRPEPAATVEEQEEEPLFDIEIIRGLERETRSFPLSEKTR